MHLNLTQKSLGKELSGRSSRFVKDYVAKIASAAPMLAWFQGQMILEETQSNLIEILFYRFFKWPHFLLNSRVDNPWVDVPDYNES